MSVRKTNGKWVAEVRNRSLNIRIRRTFDTKKEAIKTEAEIRQRIENSKTHKIGIEAALDKYLNGEAKILKDYQGLLSKAKAIRPFINKKTFDQVGSIAAEMKTQFLKKGLKPATINRRLALLRRISNIAFEWGWIDTPYGKKIKTLRGEVQRHYYLTMDEVNNLVKHCTKSGAIIQMAVFTGLRKSELFNLEQEQILDGKWIALKTNTKTSKPRLVPIPEVIRPLFKEFEWPLDNAYKQILRNEFEAARIKINMPHIRYHDLRHTYASFLVQNGATLQHIGKALGHSSTQMTNRYAHLIDDDLMDLANKFNDIKTA